MAVRFNRPEHYAPATFGYRTLPFRFMRLSSRQVLLVNEVGEFLYLDPDTFGLFVGHKLSPTHPSYNDLKGKHFFIDGESTTPIALLATKYRSKKSFLDGFTKLHLFVVTLRCDHSCHYCQVSRVSTDRIQFDMSKETAQRAVDLMFQSPARGIKVEFQGGEPLLNFDLIRFIVEYAESKNQSIGKNIEYVVATNLAFVTDDILAFLKDHSILVSTSLDGPEFIHNANRFRPGNNSHETTVHNIERVREALGHDRVSALMTTTTLSLDYPREIVDEYVRRGFNSIFLRAISPYGFAVRSKGLSNYETSRFLSFYKTALDYIIQLNRGGIRFVELYAQLLLTKILTPFATGYVDLQSPSGVGIGAVAYNYDGNVYVSDEARMLAEMGDRTFCMGNVHTHNYQQLFGGELLRNIVESSCLETLPGCSECVFQPYCGADPVFNYATQSDIIGHRPTSQFCAKNMETFKCLFGHLASEDEFVTRLFASWATGIDQTGEASA